MKLSNDQVFKLLLSHCQQNPKGINRFVSNPAEVNVLFEQLTEATEQTHEQFQELNELDDIVDQSATAVIFDVVLGEESTAIEDLIIEEADEFCNQLKHFIYENGFTAEELSQATLPYQRKFHYLIDALFNFVLNFRRLHDGGGQEAGQGG